MNKFKLAVLAAGVSLAFGVSAADQSLITKEQYKAERDRIEADYKAAKQGCDALKDNAKDVCQKEASGKEKVAKADLEAKMKGTDKAKRDALEAKAEADYELAKEKCDDLKGNDKDVCVKDAKAAHQSAKANIQTQMVGATGSSGMDSRREAKQEAVEAKGEAAKERCESLTGDAKDRCITDAKARYPK